MSEHRPVVCHVLHSLAVGGAELLARDFAIESSEHVTSVFACLDQIGDLGTDLASRGYAVKCLDRKPGRDWGLPGRLASFCQEHGVQVLHAHQYTPFFYCSLSRSIGASLPPVVFTEHGRHYPDVRKLRRVWANKLLLRKQDIVVAVGEHVKRALVANEGIPAKRIQVIRNGVHDAASSFGTKAEIRQRLGLPDGMLVVQVARLNRLKDQLTAIRAIRKAHDAGSPMFLLIVGEGEERENLEQERDRLKLQEYVSLPGLRHNIREYLQAADIFMLSSVSEGIPLTLIEAMIEGLPCVSTDVGGVGEVIEHGQSGLLTESGNSTGLAEHLVALAANADKRSAIASAGQLRAKTEFSSAVMHAAYQQLYARMAGLSHG